MQYLILAQVIFEGSKRVLKESSMIYIYLAKTQITKPRLDVKVSNSTIRVYLMDACTSCYGWTPIVKEEL